MTTVNKPTFLGIGAGKSGTTSLYNYLKRHPHVTMSDFKELYYFTRYDQYYPDLEWYHARFEVQPETRVVGEITPTYNFWPNAMKRINEYDPTLKLIFSLRNPIERAVSHYWMMIDRGLDKLPIRQAFAIESVRIERKDFSLLHHSYQFQGRYAEHLEGVLKFFPRDQILIYRLEDFTNEPDRIMRSITDFLEIDPLPPETYQDKFLVGTNKEPIPDDIRARLHEYFAPHNQRLTEKFGIRTDDWQ